MKQYKKLSLLCCLTVFCLFLPSCSSTSSSTPTASTEATSSTNQTIASTKYAKVTAIDDHSITLAFGEQSAPEPPSGDIPQDNSNADKKDTSDVPAAPDSTTSKVPTMPGNSFTTNGETATIVITTDQIIKTQSGSDTTSSSIDSIKVDSILCINYNSKGDIIDITVLDNSSNTPPDGNGQAPTNMNGSETGSISLSGLKTYDGTSELSNNETYSTTSSNENTVLIKNSSTLTMNNGTLEKTGDTTSEDESNFYGLNSILAVTSASNATISNSSFTSNAEGANAIFATGTNSNITLNNITIHTKGNSSRGLDATYGGSITGTNLTITTEGAHCAPIATDRGEGTITVTKGTLTCSGDGSPCIYSTGNITATDVTGTATGSQCAVVEGKNSITLTGCDLTGAGKNGIMIYQSTSGDAAEGSATFTSTNSTLKTTSAGEMFYITNTDATINLTNTALEFNSGILLNASGNNTNNWGKEGSNGGNITLNANSQTLKGDITCDSISTASLFLNDTSALTGAIDHANTGSVQLTLDATSSWTLTDDSYLTSLTIANQTLDSIISNGHTIYYDANDSANTWLNGQTLSLTGGGSITPMN